MYVCVCSVREDLVQQRSMIEISLRNATATAVCACAHVRESLATLEPVVNRDDEVERILSIKDKKALLVKDSHRGYSIR